ncbi:hypothetical protein SB6411_00160 [Klebsiella spallanzanii]|uniref:Sugar phosphate isomerase/epimerase n=1 Tax=Klebsiella spallanzanii TaxID=2587528 RepID=A0ABY6V4X8_9ENTR|nr:hypothetical protein SB6411_00160 [Klebsiella spallanzanii]
MNSGKFAVQLYTLRHALTEDFAGTLREVKKMGWQAVQIDGLRGHSAEEVSAALHETGLKVAGMHISPQRMVNDLDAVFMRGCCSARRPCFVTISNQNGKMKLAIGRLNRSYWPLPINLPRSAGASATIITNLSSSRRLMELSPMTT